MKNERLYSVDNELLSLLQEIKQDIAAGLIVASDDLYQSEKYCGGFEGDEDDLAAGEFTFSVYKDKKVIAWLSIPFIQIDEIITGKRTQVLASDPA